MIDLDRARRRSRRLRADIIRCTTAAGSGHPTSSLSLVDILVALVDGHLRYDFQHPSAPANDRLLLSKGHACPALYALWKAVGVISDLELLSLRHFTSRLQGHPLPEVPMVPAATGSLGMGLPLGVGLAYAGRHLERLPHRTWVIVGDGELAEGSNYEALWAAAHFRLDNLIAIVDVNRLGQRGPTLEEWNTAAYRARFEAFGWRVSEVDGHDALALDHVLGNAEHGDGRPTCILARTVKGNGVSFLADAPGWHGRVLTVEEAERALAEIADTADTPDHPWDVAKPPLAQVGDRPDPGVLDLPSGAEIGPPRSLREAFGMTLAHLGERCPGLLVLDAEVGNSTRSQDFARKFPDRFVELQIAEQLLVSVAQGLAWGGRRVVFAATFAAFFTRAHDQLRMAAISGADLRLVGTHAGVEVGEDGPSQMGLEDIALFRGLPGSTVLSPADANATRHLVRTMVGHRGITYLRLPRGAMPVIYPPATEFPLGGSKVLRSSPADVATVITMGATVHQALRAADELQAGGVAVRVIDAYSLKPLDVVTILRARQETRHLVIVEDHGPCGGLGEAVLGVLARGGRHSEDRVSHLAVRGVPRSGTSAELYEHFGLSSAAIIASIRHPPPHA